MSEEKRMQPVPLLAYNDIIRSNQFEIEIAGEGWDLATLMIQRIHVIQSFDKLSMRLTFIDSLALSELLCTWDEEKILVYKSFNPQGKLLRLYTYKVKPVSKPIPSAGDYREADVSLLHLLCRAELVSVIHTTGTSQ